jgi:hypothetical protein
MGEGRVRVLLIVFAFCRRHPMRAGKKNVTPHPTLSLKGRGNKANTHD